MTATATVSATDAAIDSGAFPASTQYTAHGANQTRTPTTAV
jgi:hypothetical protein